MVKIVKKKLQLLIPQYNEDENIIKSMLDSLQMQRGINFKDFGVIIVNDGSDVILSRDFLKQYNFEIQYHRNAHRGVSATRNMAMDLANAEYVMFCDADDCFINSLSLFNIFCEMENPFDVFSSCFIEEIVRDGQVYYNMREKDRVFVHGKIYNRLYLVLNDIKFDEELTVHEDHVFQELAFQCTNNIKYSATPFYLWCWRDDSVCRKDKDYMLKTYVNHIEGTDRLTDALFNRMKILAAQKTFVEFVYNTYYILNKSEWANNDNLDRTIKRFKDYYLKHKHLLDTCPDRDNARYFQAVRNRLVEEGLVRERITFDDWINNIVLK